MKTNAELCACLAGALILGVGCQKPTRSDGTSPLSEDSPEAIIEKCEFGAKELLGPKAKVLRCGDLSKTLGLEALAILPLTKKTEEGNDHFVSRAVIIRHEAETWRIVLDASERYIQNPGGYVGISYLPSPRMRNFKGYSLRVFDHRDDGSGGFTLVFYDLGGDLRPVSETETIIGWNPAESKYQEYILSVADDHNYRYVPKREINVPATAPPKR